MTLYNRLKVLLNLPEQVNQMALDLTVLQADYLTLHGLIVDTHTRSVADAATILELKAAVVAAGVTDPAVQTAINALADSIQADISALGGAAAAPAPATAPTGPTGVQVTPVAG